MEQETEQRGCEAPDDQAEQGEGGGEEEHDPQAREEKGECHKEAARTGQNKDSHWLILFT